MTYNISMKHKIFEYTPSKQAKENLSSKCENYESSIDFEFSTGRKTQRLKCIDNAHYASSHSGAGTKTVSLKLAEPILHPKRPKSENTDLSRYILIRKFRSYQNHIHITNKRQASQKSNPNRKPSPQNFIKIEISNILF